MKALSIAAILISLSALATALYRNISPKAPHARSETEESLRKEIEALRQRLAILEETAEIDLPATPGIQTLERKLDELAANQQDIAELTLEIDSLRILETQERELMNAYKIVIDDSRKPWERAKLANQLKRYGLFDQQAVDSMWRLFENSENSEDRAAALHALKGSLTQENSEAVLLSLKQDVEEGYEDGRLRYYGIEALEPLMPNPEIEDWLTYLAQSDPKSKIASRAAKAVGLPDPKKDRDKGKSK